MGKHFFTKIALSNIKKNSQVYLPYILSCIGSIAMFYIMNALIPAIQVDKLYGGDTVVATLKLGVYVIGFFSVIFLFYTNSFIIKRRKKELGLYNILGLEKKHISYIYIFETFFSAMLSILGGILSGIIFSKVMFLILGKFMQRTESIRFLIPQSAIINTLVLFILIFALILLYNLLQIVRSKPIDLLSGSKVGEKEPKVNWLLAIIGILALGGGYYLSVTIIDPVEALSFFFIAVILVIVGTYCLLTASMTALLKLLKRNKSYYYRPRNFTTISGMIYRMKQNASGLATICILSTCVLVMISTTFAMYTGMEDILQTRFTHQISITANDIPYENINDLKKSINDIVQSEGFDSLDSTTHYSHFLAVNVGEQGFSTASQDLSTSPSNYHFAHIMSLVQFNETYGKNLELAEDGVFCFINDENYPKTSVELFGVSHPVIILPEGTLETFSKKTSPSPYDIVHIIVPNDTILQNTLKNAQSSGDAPIKATFSYEFNISGDKESQKILAQQIQEALNNTADYDFQIESSATAEQSYSELYGGFFFLGIFLGSIFIMALVLIIYYKQISEGFEDRGRYAIMQKVGMSHKEVKRSIHSQILLVFFLPLIMSIIHLAFAMPMLIKILALMNLVNTTIVYMSTGIIILLFTAIYLFVYFRTAKTYYKIIEA